MLAVQCLLQTNPVTQPWICYIHTQCQFLDTSVLTLTFTPTLLTILIPLQPLASILQASIYVAVGHGRVRLA